MTLAAGLRVWLATMIVVGTAVGAWCLPDAVPRVYALAIGIALPFALAPLSIGIQVVVGAIVDPRRPRTTLAHVLGVWWHESLTSIRMFLWRFAFAMRADDPIARDPSRPAVLLIHGYLCNRAVWQPLLDAGVLRDCNVATVNLEPVFADIDRYADVVHAALTRLLDAGGAARAILVCHSMGGLAARVYLRRYGEARVDRVITLATPHHGTVFGRVGLGRNAKQMATGSDFLAQLAASESEALRAKFVCIATRDDNLIVPRSSPLLSDAQQRLVEGVGHLALAEDPRAWQLIADELASARRPQ
jgi:triacylglycerol esterase/lipase EstA (alpha/beta hydrolase family)